MKTESGRFRSQALQAFVLSLLLTCTAGAGPYDAGFTQPALKGLPFLGPRVKVQQDGKIIIHGEGFDAIGGVETGPVARFHPDGTRDGTFAFSRDYASAFSVAPLSNGQMIINARLESFNGSARETLLRVNADGSLDNSFNAGTGADGNIRVITIQPDGKILAGGLFTGFNASPYQCVVRLSTNGSIDPTFGPVSFSTNSSSTFQTGIWSPIVVQTDAKILLAGVFSAVNGSGRNGLVRLNTNGTVDASFVPSGFSVLNGRPVRGLGFQSDGMLIAGGRFSLGADVTRRPLVRLATNGVADANFVTTFTSPGTAIRDLTVLPDNRIIAIDDNVYRFNQDGAPDTGFLHQLVTDEFGNSFSGMMFTLAVQNDGKPMVTGMFSFVGGQHRDGVARFNTDGTLDAFDAGRLRLDSFPQKVAVQADGKILVSSDFKDANGAQRLGLARLERTGALDQNFDPTIALGTNKAVLSFVLLPDGKLFVFERILDNGMQVADKLNPDGTLDGTYPGPNGFGEGVGDAVGQPDGKMLLLANRDVQLLADDLLLRRIDSDGDYDISFQQDSSFRQAVRNPNTLEVLTIYSPGPRPLLLLTNGNWLVASLKTNRTFSLAQISTNGKIDPGFAAGAIPDAMGFTESLQFISDSAGFHQVPVVEAENLGFLDAALQPDGKIIVVGQFTNYSGAFAPCIVRLNPNGSLDPTLNPGIGPQWVTTSQISTNYFARIDAVKVLPDNKILVVGNFEAFNGFPFESVARLNPDGSVDTNFCRGLDRRDFGLYPRQPAQLIPESEGSFLVTGQFSRASNPDVIRLWRFSVRPTLSISQLSLANFRVSLSGGADRAYTVQTSTDLLHWQSLTNLSNTNDVAVFTDSPAPNVDRRLYRAASP